EGVLRPHEEGQDREFPWHAARELHDFLTVARLTDHGEVLLHGEHLPQTLSDDRMVVGDENFHLGFLLLRGMVTETRVPCPGVPVMRTSPPKSSARSCMPSSPSDLRAVSSSSWMPTPLSVTSSPTCSAPSVSSMSTRVAREWRATLVRISWKMRNIVVEMSMSNLTVSGGSLIRQRMPVRFWKSF